VLIISLRSVKIGMISLIPNMLPGISGFGVWYLVSGSVGQSMSMVLGITMGIVVDDTVHFLSKYLRARRDQGLSAEDAVRYAFKSVGVALWITTLVLVTGFLMLGTSDFKMNGDMGMMVAIVISIALAFDFFLLPPLLMLLDRDKLEEQPN
jgi:predicted RND superfamily exporter protein